MSPKKAVIILIISAIILASLFIFIYYRQNLVQNLDRQENKAANLEQKPLTDEKRQPIDILRVLNNNGGEINNSLTPAQAQAKKQELLNMLDANDKVGQSLSPADRQKKKQELLDFIK